MKVSGWGNYPVIEADVKVTKRINEVPDCMRAFGSFIPRGLGRSYGDSSLNRNICSSLGLNRILFFNEDLGIVTCEAGVSMEDIISIFVPRGWFPAVTPGTKFVTVGGAISADVHGKNHHKDGSFSDHLLSFEMILPGGDIVTCSHTSNTDLFRAACGGMGLLGIILTATFRLKKIETSYIRSWTQRAKNLEAVMDLFEENGQYTYSVAWIDCLSKGKGLGRSILMFGEHASLEHLRNWNISGISLAVKDRKKISVPFNFPNFALNKLSIKSFNFLYYSRHASGLRETTVDYDTFFYPLDALNNWNRIYGSRGFTQYQCVLPKETSRKGLREILTAISAHGLGSFLAVLKLFGKRNENLLSFPIEGYTLALDFPITNGLFDFLDRLDSIVLDYGGRLYLAKDVRMGKDMFMRSYNYAEKFVQLKHSIDKNNLMHSLQSERLGV